MIVTHDNGYTAELRDDGALFIDDADGNEILTAKHCTAGTEEKLLSILADIPSFMERINKTKKKI